MRVQRSRKVAFAALIAAAMTLVAGACQPATPTPTPPPERINLTITIQYAQPALAVGYDVAWNYSRLQIRTIEQYKFCAPQLVKDNLGFEKVREPLDPSDPEAAGIIVDGWIRKRGTVVFSVINNQACWNQDLWARFGGHPYKVGWNNSGKVTSSPGGSWEAFAEFSEVPRDEYTIVK